MSAGFIVDDTDQVISDIAAELCCKPDNEEILAAIARLKLEAVMAKPLYSRRQLETENERLRALANATADMLSEAQSGFISGSGPDMDWDKRRDDLVQELRSLQPKQEDAT
jgi:hypothetical protein